ncbi:MAG: 33 kDa chaperonin HslO [uncultured Paraburkholderia sp.]|nr:MAG: 33 kDa chaperonin HslO [uncultured Paraburkholderia sp.]
MFRRLFWQENVQHFEPASARFECTCSREKVGSMLKMLGREEVDGVIEKRGHVEIHCEFFATSGTNSTPSTWRNFFSPMHSYKESRRPPSNGTDTAGGLALCAFAGCWMSAPGVRPGIDRSRFNMSMPTSLPRPARTFAVLTALAGLTALSGCMMDPPGPSPIYSRLPTDQSGMASTAQPLTPAERQRYDAIDRQVMAEQSQAIAAESAAQAWSRYYSPPVPVTVYGSYYGGGWGHGWGTGVGFGYGPYWGW